MQAEPTAPLRMVRPEQVGLGQSEELAIQSFARQVALAEAGRAPPVVWTGNLSTSRDYSDVEDSAVGLAHLAFRGEPGEAYNFASGKAHRALSIPGPASIPAPLSLRLTRARAVVA